jgi:dTDP-6-deoxy-L-talose 4-dehydrogenase (NAD+)
MRILLTGATGFIGSAFLRVALAEGHEIAGLVVPSEPVPSLPSGQAVRWLRGTLAEAPWAEIARFRPEACVHAAWIATPGAYLESPMNPQFVRWSREFIRRVQAVGVDYVLALGTCVEYRRGREPLSEDTTPLAPTSLYARCKNQMREQLEEDAASLGFTLGWGRVFYPYGVGEHPARLCSSLIRKLTAGEPVMLRTPDSTKDYLHIRDLADALLLVTERRFRGCINLGTGVGITVRALAQMLAGALDRIGLVTEAQSPERDPLDFVVAEASRLRSLGWQPRVSLNEGLRELIGSLGA